MSPCCAVRTVVCSVWTWVQTTRTRLAFDPCPCAVQSELQSVLVCSLIRVPVLSSLSCSLCRSVV